MQTRGVVFVHSAAPALTPHVEWAISAALRVPVTMRWVAQPAEPGTVRSELAWSGPSGTASSIASALRAWSMLAFEVTEDPTAGTDGERIAQLPGQPPWRSQTSVNGDLVVTENQLRALASAARTAEDFRSGIESLLGAAYDAELEVYRQGGDGAPVTWIHRAG